MSSPVKNLSGGSIDGDLSVSGKVKGAQGSSSGEAVMLGSDGKIPTSLIDVDAIVEGVISALPTAEGGSY